MGRFGLRLAAALAAASFAATAAWAGTLDDVRARGKLICGVSDGLPGFSDKDAAGAWHGFDVDFCRAVAAAALRRSGQGRLRAALRRGPLRCR